ncbi:GMC oxidoreductase [Kribbella sp. CA-293567]|uniref:GMC oxidoreductase n=1 Tax=Kribbella sp. CA-293567 TaxID=3002436 RepID=UPI0022DE453B|nr:GMC family oxidoreductase [Kribbella sp. CA-293567]WBQ07612.1 GMC family oxidoreductase [Kribbella sp. CA-293567]
MADRVVVIGSGAGGSVAAMVLAEARFDVLVLERGPAPFPDGRLTPAGSHFGADELKGPVRRYEYPDQDAEPRVFVHRTIPAEPVVGEINALPSVVGGGTVHWDAKTPRYWDIDFKKLSLLGPIPGAEVVDWPLEYDELVPHYETIETLLGVQGDIAALPAHPTLARAPRRRQFPLPPGVPQRTSAIAAQAAASIGLHPYPMPMAIASRPYDGRAACTDCGHCDGFGCPTEARASAWIPLRRAMRAGAELRSGCFVTSIRHTGGRATGVSYLDPRGQEVLVAADLVVLAGSSVESIRIALLSDLPDPSGLIGRGVMFHSCTAGYGLLPGQDLDPGTGRGHTHALDDFADPDFGTAREAAREAGLPYIRGGVVALGIAPIGPITEGHIYSGILQRLSPERPFGTDFKRLMRTGLLRRSLLGLQMHAEDLRVRANRLTLDATVRDWRKIPVPRIDYGPHKHEVLAQEYYATWLHRLLRAAGATSTTVTPEMRSGALAGLGGAVLTDSHTLGGLPMGSSPKDSVTGPFGRMWSVDNVLVADGSVFPTSGAHNPTLTLMAMAHRNAGRLSAG